MGLAETGTQEDIPLIESYITDLRPVIQFVSLYGLYTLDAGKARPYALQLLVHPTKKIRMKCVYILKGYLDDEVLAKLKILFDSGTPIQKKTLLHLYDNQGGWEVLSELLRATQDADLSVQNMAWRFLRNWQSNARQLYTRPPMATIQKIEDVYQSADFKKMNMDQTRKQYWKELESLIKYKTE